MSPQSLLLSIKNAIIRRFRPHKAEALLRIRFNILGLIALVILATILPLPSLPTAIAVSIAQRYGDGWSNNSAYQWLCLAEVALATIFSFNILESGYSLKYPPPVAPASARSRNGLNLKSPKASSKTTPQKPFSVLSPQSSPQPQKPFAFAPGSSLSASAYPPSPVSTPTRITQYASVMTPRSSLASSTSSSVGYTPSPATRKQFGRSVGRPLDGSYLGRMAQVDDLTEADL